MEGLLGLQFGLNWDGQVLRLEGIETHQLPGFSQQAHSHLEGSAQLAWDNALLSNLNLDGNQPVMTLHFALQPGADRGTSIELTQPVLVGSQGSERAAMGVASYYHPEGGTLLSSQGQIRSMHRSEGSRVSSLPPKRVGATWWKAPRTWPLASGKRSPPLKAVAVMK